MEAPLYRLLSRTEFNKLNNFQQRVYLGLLIAEALDRVAEAERLVRESRRPSEEARRQRPFRFLFSGK
jgi:hypothetical protein